MKQIIRRGLAALIDYFCILLYAGVLLGIAMLFRLHDFTLSPLMGQLLGLITLTIPVVSFFIFAEKGRHGGTPGKRTMGLVVVAGDEERRTASIILRNIIKFLPWEMAHTGLHWLLYYDRTGANIPSWVMVMLIIPQVIMFVFLLSILLAKNGRGLYDRWSDTSVTVK